MLRHSRDRKGHLKSVVMHSSAPEFPRLLFITNEPPQTTGAGSIIFYRLFQHYPSDRIRVVTNAEIASAEKRLRCHYIHLPLMADRLNRTRFWLWRAGLRALGAPSAVRLRRIDRAAGEFRPDVVISLMQDPWYYDVATRYARQRRRPLILFIHDVPAGFAPVWPWLRPQQRRRDAEVYRQAFARLCVSPGMVAHFSASFQAEGEVLLPPRSDTPVSQSASACEQLKRPGTLTLGYAGGLHYGYGEQLMQMLPLLRETKTVVEVFGPMPGGHLSPLREASDVFRFNGYISPPEAAWQLLIDRCDVVLQPYLDPPGPHESQYRTHFPSKLGDCLSLGLPLLITGPSYASGVRWCAERPNAALIVTDPSPAAVLDAISRLKQEGQLRVKLAEKAQVAAAAFDGTALRARLYEILNAAYAHGRAG